MPRLSAPHLAVAELQEPRPHHLALGSWEAQQQLLVVASNSSSSRRRRRRRCLPRPVVVVVVVVVAVAHHSGVSQVDTENQIAESL